MVENHYAWLYKATLLHNVWSFALSSMNVECSDSNKTLSHFQLLEKNSYLGVMVSSLLMYFHIYIGQAQALSAKMCVVVVVLSM